MELCERTADTAYKTGLPRGTEAVVDDGSDLVMQNPYEYPLCLLCYYTPRNGSGTQGSVTMEMYGMRREAGISVKLETRVLSTEKTTETTVRYNPGLPEGVTLLTGRGEDGAEVATLRTTYLNGRAISSDTVCTSNYPPRPREIELRQPEQ